MVKRKLPKTAWKKGTSGNPRGGRPKSDHTWGAIFAEIGNLTGKAAAKRCHSIAGQLADPHEHRLAWRGGADGRLAFGDLRGDGAGRHDQDPGWRLAYCRLPP